MSSSGNHKALGFIWIIVIAAAVLFVVLGAALAYFWFWPSNLKTENLEFSDFTAVEVGWAFEVSITQSSAYSVVISADEKIFDNIEVTQIEDTLVIGLEPGTTDPSGLFRKAEITMPDLDNLILLGATQGTAAGFSNSNPFILKVSGASSLELIDINVGDAEIEVSGASTLDARGTAQDLLSIISGASRLDLSNFPVDNADMDVSGASRATINLDGNLDANVSGASTLQYIGDPTLGDINTSGGSTVRKK